MRLPISSACRLFLFLALAAASPLGCASDKRPAADRSHAALNQPIRVAHMPNLTHGPVLAARARGNFERTLAPVPVEWHVFTAGPSMIEALFAGEIDMAYIGPGPAVNGFVRSRGEAVRVLAGLTQGGAALVAREGSGFERPEDLAGRRIASPQMGNTQDLALRHWVAIHGHRPADRGGDVQVLGMPPADQLTLFRKGELDGAWAVEPWVTRLVQEGPGRVILEEAALWPEGRYATTLLVVRAQFLKERPDAVKRWLAAHEEMQAWTAVAPDSVRDLAAEEIFTLTRYRIPAEQLSAAWSRLRFSSDPARESITRGAQLAVELGFLKEGAGNLDALIDLEPLNAVRRERGFPEIP